MTAGTTHTHTHTHTHCTTDLLQVFECLCGAELFGLPELLLQSTDLGLEDGDLSSLLGDPGLELALGELPARLL